MGKLAIVTGATGSLGQEFVRRLVGTGHDRIVLFGRTKEKLEKTKSALVDVLGDGVELITKVVPDFKDATVVKSAVDDIVKKYEAPDTFLHGASIIEEPKAFLDMKVEDIKTMVEVNLQGTLNLVHAIGNAMKDGEKKGHVILLGSTAGFYPYGLRSNYAAIKRALISYISSRALEKYKDANITFSGLFPGPTQGKPSGVKDENGVEGESTIDRVARQRALDRNEYWERNGIDKHITPEKMAKLLARVVSNNGKYLINKELGDVLEMMLDGTLAKLIDEKEGISALNGHIIGVDKFGIYLKSDEKIMNKHEKTLGLEANGNIEYDLGRKYIFTRDGKFLSHEENRKLSIVKKQGIAEKLGNKKPKNKKLKKIVSLGTKISKYAAILLIMGFVGKYLLQKSNNQANTLDSLAISEIIYSTPISEKHKKKACEMHGISWENFNNPEIWETTSGYMTYDAVLWNAQRLAVKEKYDLDIGEY